MKQNYIYLRKRTTETDVYILLLPSRSDISASNELLLINHPAKAEFHKFIYPTVHDTVLESELGRRVIKTVYEHGYNHAELDTAIGEIFSVKSVHRLSNDVVLDSGDLKAIRELYSSVGNTMHLISTSDAEPESAKYFSAESVLELDTLIGRGSAIKSMAIGHEAELVTSIHAVLERFCSVEETAAELDSAVSALMTRYRNLSEVDADEHGNENNLSVFDDSELSDMDYIVL